MDPNNPNLQKKDANMADPPLRCGDHANLKLYELWKAKTERPLSAAEEREAKLESAGVKRPPLLFVHPSKHIYGPLHISAGIINHFMKNYIAKLRAYDVMEVADGTSFVEDAKKKKA